MKISNDYVLLARDSSVDELDKMFSIFKIVDKFVFNVDKMPQELKASVDRRIIFPINYVISSGWCIDDVHEDLSLEMHIRLLDPDNKQLNEVLQVVTVQSPDDKLRFNINAQGLPCSKSGQYRFIIEAFKDNKKLAEGSHRFKIELYDGKEII